MLGLIVLRTKSFSVPIPILLPTDIKEGILETYISVTTPVVDEFGISWYTIVCVVSIPILNVLFNPDTDVVLNPDIITRSLLLRAGAVDIKADTPSDSFLTNTTFSYVSTVVSIEVISFPRTLSTETLKPPPFVSVLSKVAVLPTL